MIGKIVSIKDGIVYVNLTINIYNTPSLIGVNVIFGDRFVGEIVNAATTYVEISLVGEIFNKMFFPGHSSMPAFSSPCRFASKAEIDLIYGILNTSDIVRVGRSYIYSDYPIYLDVQRFFSGHFAILGNTGSGKSYFVSRLLQGIFYDAKRLPKNANIILFDAYGEYQQAFSKINQVNNDLNYRVFTTDLKEEKYEKLFIPFWLLSVDDICLLLNVDDIRQIPIVEKALKLVSCFCLDDSEAKSQKDDIVARCILDVIFSSDGYNEARNKIVTILTKFGTEGINLDVTLTKGGWSRTVRQCISIDQEGKFADIELVIDYLEQFCSSELELSLPNGTMMYSIQDYYNALEFALISEGVFSNNKIFDYANILKIRLNSLINSDYVNYFNCDKYISLNEFIRHLLYFDNGSKCQLVNFNINYVDDRFAKVLVKIYSRILFNFVTSLPTRASMPFHIILEEAHRYIQNDIDTLTIGYNVFDRIAKEGRKYGILLGVISQRPSEISETTISQCSNFVIFKLFYAPDIDFVQNSIPGISKAIVEKIKMFSSGTCMLFGTAFKIQVLAAVDMPDPKPYSDNCDIGKTWYGN